MKVYTLIEDTGCRPGLRPKHGLSFYFETEHRRVLLDGGPDETTWENAGAMGVDVSRADCLILSHGHYDHSGGLEAFSKICPDAAIYLHKGADGPYYSVTEAEERYIGIDPKLGALPRIRWVSGNERIDGELSLFSGVTGRRGFSCSNSRLMERTPEGFIPDQFRHEQYLVAETEGKRILFSVCAHNGILNILDRFREIYGGEPTAVFSGFHFMKTIPYTRSEEDVIRETARELKTMNTVFYTCHCTGLPAYAMMKEIMGDRLLFADCGSVAEV